MNQKLLYILLSCSILFVSGCRHSSRDGSSKTKENSPKRENVLSKREPGRDTIKVEEPKKQSREKMSGADIFEKYGSAVFMVFTSDGNSQFQGSGFFISNDGLAVSNYHVFEGTGVGEEIIKLPGSNIAYKVTEVVKKSKDNDFIIFRVNCDNTNYLPIAEGRPRIGEVAYAIGSPKGFENTFSSGEISQWRENYLIQTTVKIDHGSSGGALINEYGEVIGITSGTFDAESSASINYAWSIDVVKPYIK